MTIASMPLGFGVTCGVGEWHASKQEKDSQLAKRPHFAFQDTPSNAQHMIPKLWVHSKSRLK